MNRADWGGGDFKDVMAGVDFLVARGLADNERLGIAGWSYGGLHVDVGEHANQSLQSFASGRGLE